MIEISWPLLLTQIGTFLIAMVVVWKLFWGPLTRMMQDRSQRISGDIQRAESGRREIEALEAEYHRQMAEIEEEARKAVKEAVHQGNLAREQIIREAREESRRILEKNREYLVQERKKVLRELRGQVTEISLMVVEKVIGRKLDQSVQQKLLDDFLNEIKAAEKVG